jgi:hypothetical protein
MNYPRLVAAAVAATVFDAVYGFLVYGQALGAQFAQYPGVYRPADDMSHMPVLLAGIFIGSLVVAYIYAKGYEGGTGLAEGARFGVAIGAFVGGYVGLIDWAVLRIGRNLAISLVIVGFVEWFIIALIIGLIYRPAAATK